MMAVPSWNEFPVTAAYRSRSIDAVGRQGGRAVRRLLEFLGGLPPSEPAPERERRLVAAVSAGRAVPLAARRVRAGGVALADQVVAILADSRGLLAGLPEPAAGGTSAAGGAPGAGQQQAQPSYMATAPTTIPARNSVPVEPVT
jgi:hypothetical protein